MVSSSSASASEVWAVSLLEREDWNWLCKSWASRERVGWGAEDPSGEERKGFIQEMWRGVGEFFSKQPHSKHNLSQALPTHKNIAVSGGDEEEFDKIKSRRTPPPHTINSSQNTRCFFVVHPR